MYDVVIFIVWRVSFAQPTLFTIIIIIHISQCFFAPPFSPSSLSALSRVAVVVPQLNPIEWHLFYYIFHSTLVNLTVFRSFHFLYPENRLLFHSTPERQRRRHWHPLITFQNCNLTWKLKWMLKKTSTFASSELLFSGLVFLCFEASSEFALNH